MSTPVYLLRQVINQQLGYRNFNAFLNHFRLKLAAEKLKSEPREKVLAIALEVGFASLAPFNRAFKEQFGMTPSEYRQSGEKAVS